MGRQDAWQAGGRHPVPSGRLGGNGEDVGFPRLPTGAAYVTVHVIFTKTLAPFSRKRLLGHREAELGFQLGSSVWSVLYPEGKGHGSWNFVLVAAGCHSKKPCSVQIRSAFHTQTLSTSCMDYNAGRRKEENELRGTSDEPMEPESL